MTEFVNLVLCDYRREYICIFVRASLVDGCLRISGYDTGDNVENFWGADDYEYWYSLSSAATTKLLQIIDGLDAPETALLKHFGGPDGCAKMREICEQNGIEYYFDSYV